MPFPEPVDAVTVNVVAGCEAAAGVTLVMAGVPDRPEVTSVKSPLSTPDTASENVTVHDTELVFTLELVPTRAIDTAVGAPVFAVSVMFLPVNVSPPPMLLMSGVPESEAEEYPGAVAVIDVTDVLFGGLLQSRVRVYAPEEFVIAAPKGLEHVVPTELTQVT